MFNTCPELSVEEQEPAAALAGPAPADPARQRALRRPSAVSQTGGAKARARHRLESRCIRVTGRRPGTRIEDSGSGG